jgi:hypothetical protein
MTAVLRTQQTHSAARGDRVLARYYRATFGWPVTADSAGVWLQLGDVIDMLAVPVELAIRVDNILAQSLLGAPLMKMPGQHEFWAFLTQPRTPLRESTWAEMIRLEIGWQAPGSALRLPPLCHPTGSFRWLKRPVRGIAPPPWTAVVGAARSASSQSRTTRGKQVPGN